MKDRNNNFFIPYANPMYPMMPNDLENRVNSLERIVKRLESRISLLENNNISYSGEIKYNTSIPENYNQNMYPNAMHMM